MPANPVQMPFAWPSSDGTDPYLVLEALDDPAVAAWVDAQTARTMATFGCGPRVDALTRRLVEAYTSQDQLVVCSRWDAWAYNTWIDEAYPLGVIRRMRWDAWLAGALDIGAIDVNHRDGDDTRWVLQDFLILYPSTGRSSCFRPAARTRASSGNSTSTRARSSRTGSTCRMPAHMR
jgi:prolyl oligopeptidase